MTGRTFDFSVVGGGIAGLAIAELLQRAGASVVLLERGPRLCAGASAQQQGWFHTGALYTALQNDYFYRTMVGNLDDLMDYYVGFPSMNLKVAKHVSATSTDGWFANKTNFYFYESPSTVGWSKKAAWMIALNRAKRRTSSFENLDASRTLSRQVRMDDRPAHFVLHDAPTDLNLGATAFGLKSRDRAMNTVLIAQDLLKSFLACGGSLRLSTEVTAIERGIVRVRGKGATSEVVQARHVVVAAGKDCDTFGSRTKILMSPLLVVRPALRDTNFVRMSPYVERTLNHIVHSTKGFNYSVVGNAAYYPVAELQEGVDQNSTAHLIRLAEDVFGKASVGRTGSFVGFKTELVASSERRNYLYHIVERDNYTLVLPGKFTLCFSLAVNVCRRFGIDPVERIHVSDQDVSDLIEQPLHYRVAATLGAAAVDGSRGAQAGSER